MYVIKVYMPQNNTHTIETGYFKCCYNATVHGERATFIAWGKEKDRCKTFKTMQAAKNKLAFLRQKCDENGYISDFSFEIEEVFLNV